MKVVLIAGSLPPEFCGVGDYTARLAGALSAAGAQVFTVSLRGSADHSFRGLGALDHWLGEVRPDFIHIQYPGAAFKRSLLPLAMAPHLRGYVLTLHEYGLSHPFRQGMMRYLIRHSQAVILPSTDVAAAVPADAKESRPTTVIPVGPSFEPEIVPDLEPLARIPLIYFGFINRSRSFEDWGILLSLLEKKRPDTDVIFLTGTSGRSMEAVVLRERFKERAPRIGVQWLYQARADSLSHFLAHHPAIAYLPFVDGASERRTSLITLLRHGVPVLVTPPRIPQVHLRPGPGLIYVDRPEAAYEAFEELQDPNSYRLARADALRQSQAFSWSIIADHHLSFYASIH